jgi:hypothetical protein
MKKKALLLMASFTFGIIDTMTANTSRNDMFVKEYFPVSTLVPAILEIYQNLLLFNLRQLKMLLLGTGMMACLYSMFLHYFKSYQTSGLKVFEGAVPIFGGERMDKIMVTTI